MRIAVQYWLCSLALLGIAQHALGQATEGLGTLRYIQSAVEPSTSDSAADLWGPVPTETTSLINAAPGILPFVNNGTVFGVPGTALGDFSTRTQVTGDWGGLRTDLAQNGFFIDIYTTSYYQDVASGGLRTGSSFVQNTQASFNLDTGRAGLWSGGLLHFTLQSRYGSSPEDTFTVGASVPQYSGLLLPGPLSASDTLPSEYYLVQSLSDKFFVVFGRISSLFIPDQTLFGDSFKYYFANFNFFVCDCQPFAISLGAR
jgi:porin